MKLFSSTIAIGFVGLLVACAYQPQNKRDLLAESGFTTLSLNSPSKVAAFKKLPPHQLSRTTFKGRQVWVYPDRDICGCIYVGSQTAYNAYIKSATQQMIDTRVNQVDQSRDPYNPTQMQSFIQWDDPWDDSDAYGLDIN